MLEHWESPKSCWGQYDSSTLTASTSLSTLVERLVSFLKIYLLDMQYVVSKYSRGIEKSQISLIGGEFRLAGHQGVFIFRLFFM
jgi:hypothetical protein